MSDSISKAASKGFLVPFIKSLEDKTLSLFRGPAGCGMTSTLASLAEQLSLDDHKVLLLSTEDAASKFSSEYISDDLEFLMVIPKTTTLQKLEQWIEKSSAKYVIIDNVVGCMDSFDFPSLKRIAENYGISVISGMQSPRDSSEEIQDSSIDRVIDLKSFA